LFSAQRAHNPGPCDEVGVARAERSVYVTPVMATKTGFDRFLDEKLRDPSFRRDYQAARAEIDATDTLIRALEGARAGQGLTKAELARRISVQPEIVRRLLTDMDGNPTIGTVLKLVMALDFHIELVPNRARRAPSTTPPARRTGRAATSARTSALGFDAAL
jgi:DNA-binding phage protein